MIDDVIFESVPFVLEHPIAPTGTIVSYSMDGINYDFTENIITGSTGNGEVSFVFVG